VDSFHEDNDGAAGTIRNGTIKETFKYTPLTISRAKRIREPVGKRGGFQV